MIGSDAPSRLIRDARERAGLSIRALAARASLSPATLLDAEAGGDPRRSTLLKCLAALPSLSAEALLGRAPPIPAASRASWTFVRDVLGYSVQRLRLEIDVAADGSRVTRLVMTGAMPRDGESDDEAIARLVQLLFRGSSSARRTLAAGSRSVQDGAFVHEFRWQAQRGLSHRRTQRPDAGGMPAGLSLAAPFPEGASVPIEHAIERLELIVRLGKDAWPEAPRPGAWTDQQAVSADEPDLLPFVHRDGVEFKANSRSRTLSLVVQRPTYGLHYGIGWGGVDLTPRPQQASVAREAPRDAAAAIRRARESAGLSQRELATRLDVSPATIAQAERGQDLRRSHLVQLLDELPGLETRMLLPRASGAAPLTRRDAWEQQRLMMGVEADEERKTLVITAEGDAHAVCETLRLRRVRPSSTDLRVRYSSVQALGRRLPTVLKAIEDAVHSGDSALRTRVVARREGRLIHEIAVPAHLARDGASYSRRLFDAGFFDPPAEPDGGPQFDGAAIVPFHPVRRLVLSVTLPPGRWPEHAWFSVHPRMMLDGPLAEADVSSTLHPEGLETSLDEATRTIRLAVDWPLVGFMYDVFWERA